MAPPESLPENTQRRHDITRVLMEDVQVEWAYIEQAYSELQTEFETIVGEKQRFIAHYDCGKGCMGCPHPFIVRIQKETMQSLSPEQRAAVLDLRKRFYQVTRRRTKMSKILQALRMSTYRLGGFSRKTLESGDGR